MARYTVDDREADLAPACRQKWHLKIHTLLGLLNLTSAKAIRQLHWRCRIPDHQSWPCGSDLVQCVDADDVVIGTTIQRHLRCLYSFLGMLRQVHGLFHQRRCRRRRNHQTISHITRRVIGLMHNSQ
eukprot:5111215-Amphidinium_carterae.1